MIEYSVKNFKITIMPKENNLLNKSAPDFTLPDQIGKEHTLSEYLGKYVLLYFYPKDMTPGCTIEAQVFRDTMDKLSKHDIVVFGISKDTVASHKKFADKLNLNFSLLSDEDTKVVQDYGVWKEKSMFGKKYMGISRESFLIDPKGTIVKHYPKVTPANHAEEVLTDIEKIKQ
jgi:peroxiredoxin Q/BCP